MRVTRFRDVLWQTARKIGLDPDKDNFLINEAIPLGESLSQWVRRTFPSRDWPEWTKTVAVIPDANHIVPYDPLPSSQTNDQPRHIFRVFNVYLVDPTTTDAPVTTDYTLREEGIHVGFDHGSTVWIKYIEPPPKFTAESWLADTNFSRDDVTYSYTTGHVYKSKVSGNIGHDPAISFSPPPTQSVPQTPIELHTEIVAPLSTGNPGIAAQNQIVDVIFATPYGGLSTPIPDPPPLNTRFFVEVVDANSALLGDATVMGDGVTTLDQIVTDLGNQLISVLTGFSVSVDTNTFTIRLSDDSNFRVSQAFWGLFADINRNVPVRQIQVYIPIVAPTDGTKQVIQFPLNQDQVVEGAEYRLTFREVNGAEHVISYISQPGDNAEQILSGLITVMLFTASSDIFLQDVSAVLDTVSPSSLFGTSTPISLGATMTLPGSPWWELVPFPTALADMVMRGGYADILKEWGQTDKGTGEEQQVAQEAGVSQGNYDPVQTNELTNQQKAVSRYRIS